MVAGAGVTRSTFDQTCADFEKFVKQLLGKQRDAMTNLKLFISKIINYNNATYMGKREIWGTTTRRQNTWKPQCYPSQKFTRKMI